MPRIPPSVSVCCLISLFAMHLAADARSVWENAALPDRILEQKDSVFREVYGKLVARAERDPSDSEPLLEMAMFYQANGLVENANRCYERLDSPEANYLQAAQRFESGNYAEARDLFKSVTPQSDVFPDAQVRMAECHALLGLEDLAKETMTQVWEEYPAHERAAIGLARQKMRESGFEGARDVLIETLRKNADAGDVALLLSAVFRRLGDENASKEALALGQSLPRNGSNMDPVVSQLEQWICDPYTLSCQADLYFTSLRFDAARTLFEHGLELYPNYSELWFGLAKLEFASDFRTAAFEALDEALAREDCRLQVFEVYVAELYRDERYEVALAALESESQRFGDSAKLFRLKGNCLLALGETEQAELSYQEGIDRYPNQSSLWLALGKLKTRTSPGQATEIFRKAHSLNPYDRGVVRNYFNNLLGVQSWELAAKALEDLERLEPSDAGFRISYLSARAASDYEAGRIDEWLALSEEVYSLEKDSLKSYEMTAAYLIKRGDFQSVVRLSNVAKFVYPNSVVPLKFEALARLNLGDLEGGVAALSAGKSKAIELGNRAESRRFEELLSKVKTEIVSAK